MKKNATTRKSKATSRQSTLNFPTSSEADLVAESTADKTSTKSGAKNRKNRTADFADDADKGNKSHCDSSAISAQSAVETSAPPERMPIAQGKKRSAAALGHESQNAESPEGAKEFSVLPKGWRWMRADVVGAVHLGRQRSPKNRSAEFPTKYLRAANITEHGIDLADVLEMDFKPSERERYRLQPGDIILSEASGSPSQVGKPAIWKGELPLCCFQNTVIRLRPHAADPKYLLWLFTHFYRNGIFARVAGGVGINHLSAAKFSQLALPIAPPAEQRRIVAEIEKQFTRLEAGVAALRRVQANLKRYRASVLKAACEGRLVPTEAELRKDEGRRMKDENKRPNSAAASSSFIPHTSSFEFGEALLARILTERRQNWQGRGQYKEPAAPDTTNLSPLPEGWTWATVEQLLREKLCNGISVKGSDDPPGVRALRLSAMSNSGFDYSDARYLPLSESEVDDLWIQEGDFYMSRGNGSLHLVGRGTSAQKPPQPTIFPDTMIRIRFSDAVRTSGWLRTLWPSRIVRSQIETKVKTTAGIYKIAQPQVEELRVPLPPLAEQTRIVAEVERRLSVVEELEAVVSANLQRATRLRQSILQKAFTGELTGAETCKDGLQVQRERR